MSRHTVPIVALLAAAHLGAQQRPLQLLDNPGGESSVAIRVGSSQGRSMFDVPGWESVGGEWVAQNAPWSKVDAVDGEAFLRPRNGEKPSLRQTVEVAPGGVPRPRVLIAGAWMRTMKGKDACELRVVVQDAALGELATVTTGERNETAWAWQEVVVAVPDQAVYATVELVGIRNDGSFADAFFDGVVLEPVGPGLPAQLATLSTNDLVARLETVSDGTTRRALLRALVVDARGAKVVAERFTTEADPLWRRYLLTLLATCGRRAATGPLQAALGSSDAAERAHAMSLLPWVGDDAAKLLAPLAEARDPKVRAGALRALAVAGDAKTLAKVSRGDPVRAVEVMRAIRDAGVDVGPFYRSVIAPWLGPDEEAGARNEAMRTLGAAQDPRFLRHLTQLASSAGSQGVLAEWFRSAARFGSADAVAAVVAVVEAGAAHADRALLAVAAELGNAAGLDWARRVGIRSDSALLRLAAVRVLRAGGDAADVDAIRAATDDADPLVALEAVDALGARTGADAEGLLERLFARARGPVAAAALRELFRRAGADDGAVQRSMVAATGHRAWEVRAAAFDLLCGVPGALAVIIAGFDDPVWQVRAAAFRAAGTIRQSRAIEALVARAPDERGAALGYLVDALVELTGVDQGDDARAWQRWWGIVAADFVVPPSPERGRAQKDDGARARTTTSYYGIPIRSDNLVFIIDLSGSMTAEVGGRTKLRAAQDKLIEVLRALRPGQRFGILAFGTDVGFYERELVAASPDDVDAAVKWVERLKIRGATNIYDSLELALAFDGVESIFLLSDGGPSVGKFVDMDEICRAIRLQNRERMVRINTILIGGSERERAFMKRLAEENHGEAAGGGGRTR